MIHSHSFVQQISCRFEPSFLLLFAVEGRGLEQSLDIQPCNCYRIRKKFYHFLTCSLHIEKQPVVRARHVGEFCLVQCRIQPETRPCWNKIKFWLRGVGDGDPPEFGLSYARLHVLHRTLKPRLRKTIAVTQYRLVDWSIHLYLSQL